MNPEYITPDYCISCAYWCKSNGNFGNCKIVPEKTYDGTKKGSSCASWRIATHLELKYGKNDEIPDIKSIAVLYSRKMRNKRLSRTLPSTVTTVSRSRQRYYQSKYNSQIIEYSLTLFLKGLSYKQISFELSKKSMKIPDSATIRDWVIRFLGRQAWDIHLIDKSGLISGYVKNGTYKRKDGTIRQKYRRKT